ncbi:hypothetical protein [Pandoraea sp. ISTKB]|uniref:hypothetical protein n=1 Tax=Pandoraea sp. ISTKB TaxID=1586708 RepID=UPI0008463F44|nr:hypothetical protein [Pandoraea sp. ISTKB]ODP30595.1 hypothetical protein A9762_09340 [Pandoraea sp. ISTKB]
MGKRTPGTRATDVTTFKVAVWSPDQRLYNNGLCQVMLQIEIIADAPLSSDEMRSLHIIDSISRLEIPVVDSSMPVAQGKWGASTQRNLYDFFPVSATNEGSVPVTSDPPVPNREYFHFYIQTADADGTRKRLAAAITLDSGRTFFSDEVSGSEGQVDVLAVGTGGPPPLSAWDTEWETPEKFAVAGGIMVTVYYLGLTMNGARREIRDMEVLDEYASAYRWLAVTSRTGAFCGFAKPPSSDERVRPFEYSQTQFIGSYRYERNNLPRTGCGAVAFISDPALGPYQGAAHGPSVAYRLRDQYGTENLLRLTITEQCDAMELNLGLE